MTHKAGFVNIIGKPNVGKSTLMNALVGERLSIITSKAQTTRHRIHGILNGDDFQIIYSDTPGILDPEYELHKSMMRYVNHAFDDADVLLVVVDWGMRFKDEDVWRKIRQAKFPVLLVLNKIDRATTKEEVMEELSKWRGIEGITECIPVSAKDKTNVDTLFDKILEHLPVHPPYYDKEALSDKPERFFVDEIIREKIFLQFEKEVPYCCEVKTMSFKEEENIIHIRSDIYVERDSQKGILIGKKGEAMKKLGIAAREELESFFQKKVYLETFIKVQPNWRRNKKFLDKFGYNPS